MQLHSLLCKQMISFPLPLPLLLFTCAVWTSPFPVTTQSHRNHKGDGLSLISQCSWWEVFWHLPTFKMCPWFCPWWDIQETTWGADYLWTVQTFQNRNEKFSVPFKKYLKNNKEIGITHVICILNILQMHTVSVLRPQWTRELHKRQKKIIFFFFFGGGRILSTWLKKVNEKGQNS